MMKTLNELVSAALGAADSHMKIASASDAGPADEVGLDEILGLPANEPEEAATEAVGEETEEPKTAGSVLADAEYAMKLASALDSASAVVTKLAMESAGAGDPVVSAAEHINEKTQSPVAQTNSVEGGDKSHAGAPLTESHGMPNAIANTKDDFRDPDWTKNKEAAMQVLQAKTAQAEQFFHIGEHEKSAELLDEIESIQEKLAADPSSPQAQLPSARGVPTLDTSAGMGSHVPDNAGMASLTRSAARDSSTREATQYFSEAPKLDNAVAAHVGKTDGLKISSQEKQAVSNDWIAKKITKGWANAGSRTAKHAPKLLNAANKAGLGISEAQGKAQGLGKLVRNMNARTQVKAVRDRATKGRFGALKEMAKKGPGKYVEDVMDETARKSPGFQKMMGKSSMDETQLRAAKALLQKHASKITNPDATESEKVAAAEIINTVRERLGDEQTAALLS